MPPTCLYTTYACLHYGCGWRADAGDARWLYYTTPFTPEPTAYSLGLHTYVPHPPAYTIYRDYPMPVRRWPQFPTPLLRPPLA